MGKLAAKRAHVMSNARQEKIPDVCISPESWRNNSAGTIHAHFQAGVKNYVKTNWLFISLRLSGFIRILKVRPT
jgi:hypothetical protein